MLNIRTSEKKIALWSLLLAFLIGCIQCYLSAVPLALFLSHYSSSNLPQIYLAIAAVALIFGGIYTFFEYRLIFNRLIFNLILVIASITTLFWLVLIGFKVNWVFVALIIWAAVAFDLFDLAFWSVLNRIYTLQQGKRLFGIIGAGQSLGGLLSGLLLPLLIKMIGTNAVILFAGILSFFALLIMLVLQKKVAGDRNGKSLVAEQEQNTNEIKLNHVLRQKYILKIFMMTAFGVFAMYIIDMMFNTVAEAKYPTEEALAGFLGVFFGLVDGVDLLCSTFVLARLLERLGLIISLLILPVMASVIAVILLILNVLPAFAVLIFWIVACFKLIEESIRASINDASSLLLLQPLSPRLRSFVQSKNETIIIPLSTAVISIILMIVSATVGIEVSYFAFAALLCFGSNIFIITTLKSDYIKALTNAIANRYFVKPQFQRLDKESLPLFKHYLKSAYPEEVIYALETIEHIDEKEFRDTLANALNSENYLVRIFVLHKIKEYNAQEYYQQICELLKNDSSIIVKAEAIKTLAIFKQKEVIEKIKCYIENEHLVIRTAAIIALVGQGDVSSTTIALQNIRKMAKASEQETRRSCAYIIGETNQQQTNNLLDALVFDRNKAVQNEALLSVAKTNQIDLLPELLKNLVFLPLRSEMFSKFIELETKIIPIIRENFHTYNRMLQIKLIRLLGHMRHENVLIFLEEIINNEDDELRLAALSSVVSAQFTVNKSLLTKLYFHIEEEVSYLKLQYHYASNTPLLELTQLLQDVFKRKILLSIERLLLSLAIFYSDKSILKAKMGLEKGDANEISYSLELIDSVISTEHKKIVSPILNEIYFAQYQNSANLKSKDFSLVLRENLIDTENPLSVLGSIASIYIIKKANLESCYDDLNKLKNAKSTLIQETFYHFANT